MQAGKKSHLITCLIALAATWMSLPTRVDAKAGYQSVSTPAELIEEVNSLRISYGLRPLAVHPVLMQVAQIEADGIANGAGGHWRPNGLTLGQWLISLGYPLSGDLSLDGYRSENWVSAETAQGAVQAWLGDDPHTNTMLSPDRSDIGAGVSVTSDGQSYMVIETALRTSSGLQQSDAAPVLTQIANSGGTPSSISEYINPVVQSTALPNGDVFHTVQNGQSLWSIAIDYETKIKNIQALNNLGDDLVVYQGQKLLVLKNATQPPPSTPTPARLPTHIPTLTATASSQQIVFPFTEAPEIVNLEAANDSTKSGSSPNLLVILLIVASFVGGGAAVWLIRDPKA